MTAAVRAYIDSLARDPLRDDLRVTAGGRIVGRFLRAEIDSAFQPVAELAAAGTAARIVAFQALARVHSETGAELSPWNLFTRAASDDDLVLLDRRCRVVHTLNFFSTPELESDLLLNVHDRLLSAVTSDHGRAFRRVLDGLAIPVRRVVIILPPLTAERLDLHSNVLASFRLNGFRVAVTGDQPLELRALLARIPTDIVRIDARHLTRSGWAEAIDEARRQQAQVHVTRVEDDATQRHALALGATHWQGWLLARPAAHAMTTSVSA